MRIGVGVHAPPLRHVACVYAKARAGDSDGDSQSLSSLNRLSERVREGRSALQCVSARAPTGNKGRVENM